MMMNWINSHQTERPKLWRQGRSCANFTSNNPKVYYKLHTKGKLCHDRPQIATSTRLYTKTHARALTSMDSIRVKLGRHDKPRTLTNCVEVEETQVWMSITRPSAPLTGKTRCTVVSGHYHVCSTTMPNTVRIATHIPSIEVDIKTS